MKSLICSWMLLLMFGLLVAAAPTGDARQVIQTTINQPYFDLVIDDARGRIYSSQTDSETSHTIQTDFTATKVYLPVMFNSFAPRGIIGTVTHAGGWASGVPLELRFYDGSSWVTAASTTTGDDGSYVFKDVNSLEVGQYYYVSYSNESYNTGNVYYYATRSFGSYKKGSEMDLGNFDIKDISLNSPVSGATVSLPATFTWSLRTATPGDSYEFDLYDPYSDVSFYTDPPLGYVGQYTLTALPSGFVQDKEYHWEIWVYDPLGGFGISLFSLPVRFSNSGSSSQGNIPQEKIPTYLNRSAHPGVDRGH